MFSCIIRRLFLRVDCSHGLRASPHQQAFIFRSSAEQHESKRFRLYTTCRGQVERKAWHPSHDQPRGTCSCPSLRNKILSGAVRDVDLLLLLVALLLDDPPLDQGPDDVLVQRWRERERHSAPHRQRQASERQETGTEAGDLPSSIIGERSARAPLTKPSSKWRRQVIAHGRLTFACPSAVERSSHSPVLWW